MNLIKPREMDWGRVMFIFIEKKATFPRKLILGLQRLEAGVK